MANTFAQRNFGKWQHKALGIDAKTMEKARKVHALAVGGATAGERAAAMDRLSKITMNANGGFDSVLKALA